MIDQTTSAFGRLDMAFNNAGIMVPLADAAEEQVENFDRVNAVNYRGVWACMKHELRQMRTQGSGAIVNCSGPRCAPSFVRMDLIGNRKLNSG